MSQYYDTCVIRRKKTVSKKDTPGVHNGKYLDLNTKCITGNLKSLVKLISLTMCGYCIRQSIFFHRR